MQIYIFQFLYKVAFLSIIIIFLFQKIIRLPVLQQSEGRMEGQWPNGWFQVDFNFVGSAGTLQVVLVGLSIIRTLASLSIIVISRIVF